MGEALSALACGSLLTPWGRKLASVGGWAWVLKAQASLRTPGRFARGCGLGLRGRKRACALQGALRGDVGLGFEGASALAHVRARSAVLFPLQRIAGVEAGGLVGGEEGAKEKPEGDQGEGAE